MRRRPAARPSPAGGVPPGLRLLAVAAILLATAAATSDRPLGNEDVVRMVMHGAGEREILQAIAAHPPAYDLDPDVVVELRRAGVGDRIIEAMRQRQAAVRPPAAAPTPGAAPAATPAAGPTGTLEIVFDAPVDPDHPSADTAIALKSLPKGAERQPGQEVGLMSDMAFAVLCVSADHVPDNWDAHTPLVVAPRHEMLLFRPGSGTEKRRGLELLYLARLESYSVVIPAGSHRIVVGAAGKDAGTGAWRLLASDESRVAIVPGGTTRLTVHARSTPHGSLMIGFGVDSEWKVVATGAAAGVPSGGPS